MSIEGSIVVDMMETEIRRCCFTGHRPEKLKRPSQGVAADLESEIVTAIKDGVTVFIIGMEKGTDFIAGEIVLRMCDAAQPIHLIFVVLCQCFERSWSKEWKQRYEILINKEDETHFICSRFFRGCFRKRNRWMVDHSIRVLAVYNGSPGGMKNTINYAWRKRVEVIAIEG